jgi:hypothetical protein
VNHLTTAAFLLAGAAVLQAPCVFAQPTDPPRPRFEVGIGSLSIGQQPLGTKAATETTGAGGSTPLFSTSSELASAVGMAGRIGVRLTRSLVAEAEASYLTPQLRVAISGDVEGAAAVTATETIQQFTIGGGMLWYVTNHWWTSRFEPFVIAGGGYLQQLHDPATLVESGHYYQFGGGATYLLVASPRLHTNGIGARADVRALVRSKGVALDGGGHASPAFGVSAFVRF